MLPLARVDFGGLSEPEDRIGVDSGRRRGGLRRLHRVSDRCFSEQVHLHSWIQDTADDFTADIG